MKIRLFEEKDIFPIEGILRAIGWPDQYVAGQLQSIQSLYSRKAGEVYVATYKETVAGFIQAEHHLWNRLSYLHGLVVHPDYRRLKIGKSLLSVIEESSKRKGNRGLYVDTPVDNVGGRKFYTAASFKEAYRMPDFYEPGLDGITFQKFFDCHGDSDITSILEDLKAREPIFHHPDKFGATKQDILNMVADEFWEVGASGTTYTKQDVIGILLERYSDPTYQDRWETKDLKMVPLGEDTYLLTYLLIQDNIRITRRSTIWRQVKGEWKIFYHQGTLVQEPQNDHSK